jgi:hypothetical protein
LPALPESLHRLIVAEHLGTQLQDVFRPAAHPSAPAVPTPPAAALNVIALLAILLAMGIQVKVEAVMDSTRPLNITKAGGSDGAAELVTCEWPKHAKTAGSSCQSPAGCRSTSPRGCDLTSSPA